MSYNSLFGLASHSGSGPDNDLQGWWKLQEVSGSFVEDFSGKNIDATLTGAPTGVVTVTTDTGPHSWLPTAYVFDNDSHIITPTGDFNLDYSSITLFARFNSAVYNNNDEGIIGKWKTGSRSFIMYIGSNDLLYWLTSPDDFSTFSQTDAGAITRDGTVWYDTMMTMSGTDATIYVNGSIASDADFVTSTYYEETPKIGIDIGSYDDNSAVDSFDGRLADVGIFSRALTSGEATEWYEGPEPYKVNGTPNIAGDTGIGGNLILDFGEWDSQNNGSIIYGYELYSYATVSGSGEQLEKIGISYYDEVTIPIKGQNLEGRYLRFKVSGQNDGGYDLNEVYWSSFSSLIGSGTNPTYESYNAIIGKGKHFQDENLEGYWPLGNETGMVMHDISKYQRHGALSGQTGVSPDVRTGHRWMDYGLDFDGTDDFVDLGDHSAFNPGTGALTAICFYKTDSTASIYRIIQKRGTGAFGTQDGWQLSRQVSSWQWANTGFDSGDTKYVTYNANGDHEDSTDGGWYHIAIKFDPTEPTYKLSGAVGGVLQQLALASSQPLTDISTSRIATIGCAWNDPSTQSQFLNGGVHNAGIFSRALTFDEMEETRLGPEPINIGIPTIAGNYVENSTLVITDSGNWDSQNNGNISYSVQWVRDGVDISGETSNTYTLTASDLSKDVRVKIRASNDGGFDALEDTLSNSLTSPMAPYISGLPYISGDPVQGENITLFAGNWISPTSGTITYRYKLKSFSGVSGADPIVEKISYSTGTSIEAYLNQPSLVGRTLNLTVDATDSGTRQAVSSGYTSGVASGIFTDYSNCYNYHLGKGRHTNLDSLKAYLPGTDTTGELVSRYVKDEARETTNTYTGDTLGTRTNNSISSGYLPNGLDFQAATASGALYAVSGIETEPLGSGDNWTISLWGNADNDGGGGFGRYFDMQPKNNFMYRGTNDARYKHEGTTTYLDSNANAGSTYHLAAARDSSINTNYMWQNAVGQGTYTDAESSNGITQIKFGNWGSAGGGRQFNGMMAGIAIFNETLDTTKISELYNGPEPYNLVLPDVSGNDLVGNAVPVSGSIFVDEGLWDSQDNGAITYGYQWYRADDNIGTNEVMITGATSDEYVAESIYVNKFVRSSISGSNDGGYDPYEVYFTPYIEIGVGTNLYTFNRFYDRYTDLTGTHMYPQLVWSEATISGELSSSLSNFLHYLKLRRK